MTYLNNAATSWPKPATVRAAISSAMESVPIGQLRSCLDGEDVFDVCRRRLAALFHFSDPSRIFFTSGATEALNILISGLPLAGKPVLVTQTEHNSVLRPVYNHPALRKQVRVIPCDPDGRVRVEDVERMMKAHAAETGTADASGCSGLIIVNHCSNVTGAVQDMKAICDIARRQGFLTLTDASQSAGCLPVDMDGWMTDMLVFTGHKSLLGPQGTGGYCIRKDIPLRPLLFGGTGRDSRVIVYSDDYEYEAGTQNAPGTAGLSAGVKYILDKGVERIMTEEERRIRLIDEALRTLPGVKVYGNRDTCRGPLLSFTVDQWKTADIGYMLQNAYGIVVRTGLHCSPLIHEALGTAEDGTVRVSISDMTTDEDIRYFINSMTEICRAK